MCLCKVRFLLHVSCPISVQCIINIIFERVGKIGKKQESLPLMIFHTHMYTYTDPVTRGLSITVHWLGINVDVSNTPTHTRTHSAHPLTDGLLQVMFWSQHVSFILVGIIVITSIRGLLITLTKVRGHYLLSLKFCVIIFSLCL